MEKRAKNSSVSLEDLPPIDLEKMLREKGYSSGEIDALLKKDILFISPKKIGSTSKEAITPNTLDFKKLLAQEKKDLKIDFAFDKAGYKYLELLSAEIYVGVIVFLSITAWDIVKGFISSWLYAKYVGMKKGSKSLNAQLEVEVIDAKKGRTYHLKYAGPADEVADIIKKADLGD